MWPLTAPGLLQVDGSEGLVDPYALLNPTSLGWAAVIAAVVTVFTSLGWISGIRDGVRGMMQLGPRGMNPVLQILHDVGTLLLLGVALVTSAAASLVFGTAADWVTEQLGLDPLLAGPLTTSVTILVPLLLGWGTALIMFRVAAGLKPARRSLLEGTILAAVGTTVLQIFSTQLLASAGKNPILAPFAIIIGLLIWFNLVSQVYVDLRRVGGDPGAGPQGRRPPPRPPAGVPGASSRARRRWSPGPAGGRCPPRSGVEVLVGPRRNNLPGAGRLALGRQQVVAALEGHEAARMPRRLEDGAGVLDAHGVVRGGVQHQQRLPEPPDAVREVRVLQVLHEVPADLHPLAAQVHFRASLAEDPVQGGVEDVGHVLGRERRPHGGDGVELRDAPAAARTAAPPKEWPTSSETGRPESRMNSAALTVSATLWLKEPSDHRPADSPSPRLSKRSMPTPLSASALHIRDAEGLSLPSVKPCENTPQPFTGPSGTSTMPESSSPVEPWKETFSERDTVSPFVECGKTTTAPPPEGERRRRLLLLCLRGANARSCGTGWPA